VINFSVTDSTPPLALTETYSLEGAANLSHALEHIEGHDGTGAETPLPPHERDTEHAEDREEGVDLRCVPRLGVATPLERKEERGGHGDSEDGADPVKLEPLAPTLGKEVLVLRHGLFLEEDKREEHSDGTNREVD
jgi:hypothetical protein